MSLLCLWFVCGSADLDVRTRACRAARSSKQVGSESFELCRREQECAARAHCTVTALPHTHTHSDTHRLNNTAPTRTLVHSALCHAATHGTFWILCVRCFVQLETSTTHVIRPLCQECARYVKSTGCSCVCKPNRWTLTCTSMTRSVLQWHHASLAPTQPKLCT